MSEQGPESPNAQGPALVITLGIGIVALNALAGGGPGVALGALIAVAGLLWMMLSRQGRQRP